MKKFSLNQWLGIFLIISALLFYVRLPLFLSGIKSVIPIFIAIVGLYELFR